MRGYFEHGKPIYGWFRALDRVCRGIGHGFSDGDSAHLDLLQEATDPTWSALAEADRRALLATDLPFLEWQIRTFPLDAVICAGKTVSNHVRSRFEIEVIDVGAMARIKWWVGRATLERGDVGFAGWNLPLARPTGLGAAGESALGELIRDKLGLA